MMGFEAIEQVYLFLERGGNVLYGVMAAIFLMWFYMVERGVYLVFFHRRLLAGAIREWEGRAERKSWAAHQIRADLVGMVEGELTRNLPLIKMLVSICPLFGLLGTVVGMIGVFDVMAYLGSSSPKAMAAGISKATIPTMAGMIGAITGVFGHSLLERTIRREKSHLEDLLTFDH